MVYKPTRRARYVSCTNEKLKPYFFINDKPFKHIHVNRAANEFTVYSFEDRKRYLISWIDAKRNHEKAFTIAQTARLIGRDPTRLYHDMADGKIPIAHYTHNLRTGERSSSSTRLYSESQLKQVHWHYANTSRNKRAASGLTTNNTVTPWPEIQERIGRQGDVLYKKNKDGEFIPIWKEE